MTLETFTKLLDNYTEAYSKSMAVSQLGINLDEYSEIFQKNTELLLNEVFTEEGIEWIFWFLYEKDYIEGALKEDMKAWDEHDQEICQDAPRLYRFLVQSEYVKTLKA
jgi:hypothetical protein